MSKFFTVLLLACSIVQLAFGQSEFQLIESRIIASIKAGVNTVQLNKEVKSNLVTIQNAGFWPDIEYSSTGATNWAPLAHLNKIKQFALALNSPEFSSDANFASQINTALRYWLKVKPSSKNWFQNEIAVPTTIGEILLLLKKSNILPSSLQDSLLNSMKQGDVEKAIGANKLDISIHMMYRACVSQDKMLMDSAVSQAFKPITIANKEGLQSDYSYRQHGPQLQIASYGQVFLIGEYKVASWLLATSYALPAEKLKMLDRYLINTFLKTIRGRYIDFNTEGRGISRNDVLDKIDLAESKNKEDLLSLAMKVNPENTAQLNAAIQRISQKQPASYGIVSLHNYFYKSDYTIHNRPAYSFNVRTVSKRTIRTETGNKENLLGKFLPDGSTNIQRTGSEYFNIMPIWEWDKIPGITGRDYPGDEKSTIEWGERGIGDFIGGTTDVKYGTTVYQLDYNEVLAKKAWFFFDDEVVCLGADISSYANEPITTCINQAWKKGAVKVCTDKLISVDKQYFGKNIKWIWHDSIAYCFPNLGEIKVSNQIQTGSWNRINANRSSAEIKGKVFKLWFNHGIDPEKQSYAYIVKPNVGLADLQKEKVYSSKIVANTSVMQAVENTDLQMVQVVFYEAGALKGSNYSISVDQPCVLMLKKINTKNPEIYLSDPTQKLTDLNISFNSSFLQVLEPKSVSLPQGDNKGATVSFQFN